MQENISENKQEATDSGTRPFSPIYNNFQNLLENNQGIFRLFRKAKNPGMYQAVWLSRQCEVDTYQQRLLQCELNHKEVKKELLGLIENLEVNHAENEQQWNSKEIEWFEQQNGQRQSIKYLEEKLKEMQIRVEHQKEEAKKIKEDFTREKQALKRDLLAQKEETQKFRILSRSLERVIKMNTHKDSKYEEEIKKLEDHLNLSQNALIRLDNEYDQSLIESQKLKKDFEQLEQKYEESERYNKEFKRINHRMENELYRVTAELENMQSYLN